MWFFKKKKQAPKHQELTEQELEEARRRWREFHNNLPKEFTLASHCQCLDVNGARIFRDFHFVMDPKIPGLYRAKFDWRI
ncbi:MAG: hypothetical protein ABR875_03730 [Minisyncoccia bacterium]|jgi:hypothetical protein